MSITPAQSNIAESPQPIPLKATDVVLIGSSGSSYTTTKILFVIKQLTIVAKHSRLHRKSTTVFWTKLNVQPWLFAIRVERISQHV